MKQFVTLRSVVVLTAVLLLGASDAPRLLAVLPLDVSHTNGKLSKDAEAALEELLRDTATDAVSPAGWTVLTGQNTLKILEDNGVDPAKACDATCALGAARELKAGLAISGAIQWSDGEFTASIRLLDVTSGRIVASERLRGTTGRALRDAFEPRAASFFAKSGLVSTSAPPAGTSPEALPSANQSTAPAAQVKVSPELTEGMVAIPGGTFTMGAADGDEKDKPATRVTLSPYYIDRLEVSAAQYRACVESGKCLPIEQVWSGTPCNWSVEAKGAHAVNCVNWYQAGQYCEAHGRRLPTEAEWEFAARGTDGRKYPWGDTEPTHALANYGKDYNSGEGTEPVDSHPEGASAFGLLNMAGNVAEWVEDEYTSYPGTPLKNPMFESNRGHVYRGGWDGTNAGLTATARDRDSAAVNNVGRGFRCAVSLVPGALAVGGEPVGAVIEATGPGGARLTGAIPWQASNLTVGTWRLHIHQPGHAAAYRTVWVKPEETTSVSVALRPVVVHGGAEMVSIPGGTFTMGSLELPSPERLTVVTLSPYFMDRTEVSVAQYKACVKAGKCSVKGVTGAKCNWKASGKENHPMNCVDWSQAGRYCKAQGGRLPTNAEWEFAARGTDGRLEPWGYEEVNPTLLNFGQEQENARGTDPADSHPEGASPFGVLNLAGNVAEWVEDYHAPYPGGSVTNPVESGTFRDTRGGDWGATGWYVSTVFRAASPPEEHHPGDGFRCVHAPF
jgi:formylglycine-generating enzyme required for sulfatase activity